MICLCLKNNKKKNTLFAKNLQLPITSNRKIDKERKLSSPATTEVISNLKASNKVFSEAKSILLTRPYFHGLLMIHTVPCDRVINRIIETFFHQFQNHVHVQRIIILLFKQFSTEEKKQ